MEELNSDAIRGLSINGWITPGVGVTHNDRKVSDGRSIIIACPSTYKLTTVINGTNANIVSSFRVSGTVGVKPGNITASDITTDYNVYIYPITNDVSVEYTTVEITKA